MFVKYCVCMRKSLYVYVGVSVCRGGGKERGRGSGRGSDHILVCMWGHGSQRLKENLQELCIFFQHVDSGRELILSGLASGSFTHWAILTAFTSCLNIPSYRNLHRFINTILLPCSITQLKWVPLPGIFFLDKLNPGFKIQLTPYTDHIN